MPEKGIKDSRLACRNAVEIPIDRGLVGLEDRTGVALNICF